jgi:acyl-CoA synthetase (AMP-forming)/AMP-acid ligase II
MVGAIAADMEEAPGAPRVHLAFEGLPEGDPERLARLVAAPAVDAVDDVRWIYYTSGTTSEPKGVRHSDRTLLTGGEGLARALELTDDDVGSIAFPFAHIAGPDYLTMVLACGITTVMLEAFVPEVAVEVFSRHGATLAGGSTAFYQAYLAEQRKHPGRKIIPSLRLLTGGGAPMPPEVFAEVGREIGVRVAHGYGMTEIPMITMGSPSDSDEQLANTVGRPVHGAELRVVTLDEKEADAGEDGEIRVRGPMVCKGYTDPVLSDESFDDRGYFRTGDVGHVRPDGHVVLTGRLKDIIIRKGENISAKEIEDLLYQHPKVGDVAVVGLADPERGERVCAVVETAAGNDPITFAEMTAHLRLAGLMAQKIPEQLEVVEALPRNQTLNKVLKYKLREELAAKPFVPPQGG